jgi:SSS family solute:Na+ symporter
MLAALTWQDNAVILVYLAGMVGLGLWLGRRERSDEEYFLAGRKMPWFAVGVSVIASILSSITYLSEPGEIWKSGATHIAGKMLAIPVEMALVFFVCIPFMMRFRFTSAYDYLGLRFGAATRRTGVGLFILLVVLWMGFVVLASARVLSELSGWPLLTIIAAIGLVATSYTMIGGLRAVIWTDVVQVALLIAGGLFTIGYVAFTTGTWIPEWYEASTEQLRQHNHEAMPFFSFDPTTRVTVLTVAVHMCIWHVCTHLSNQMTVQRYFSTLDARAARRSFVTGSLVGVGINLMLVVVGLSLVYFYFGQQTPVENDLIEKGRHDLIFPTFAINRLPPGVGGGILAALLAAAMSSIDSGINSIATVLSAEASRGKAREKANHVRFAMKITCGAGLFITVAAYGLSFLPDKWGIVAALPRTFNAVTGPLGGLFMIGMFFPRAGQRAAIAGVCCGLFTSVSIGYSEQIGNLLSKDWPALSFTWVMPCSISVTLLVAWLVGLTGKPPTRDLAGLTWKTRHAPIVDDKSSESTKI